MTKRIDDPTPEWPSPFPPIDYDEPWTVQVKSARPEMERVFAAHREAHRYAIESEPVDTPLLPKVSEAKAYLGVILDRAWNQAAPALEALKGAEELMDVIDPRGDRSEMIRQVEAFVSTIEYRRSLL
jgi:hypothetical protein